MNVFVSPFWGKWGLYARDKVILLSSLLSISLASLGFTVPMFHARKPHLPQRHQKKLAATSEEHSDNLSNRCACSSSDKPRTSKGLSALSASGGR